MATAVLLHLLIISSLLFSVISSTPPTPTPLTPTPRAPTPRPLQPPPPALTNCSDELVAFSVCLPYISSHPNNHTRLPSSQCCHAIASSVNSHTAICLCYFIRQPLMLGFPLNSSRLFSLAKLCQGNDRKKKSKFSLKSLCAELSTLPPLRSITGPDGHPIHWNPCDDGINGSPVLGPDNVSRPSTCPWETNSTKPVPPVQQPVPTPAATNITETPRPVVPTPASTNITETPRPVVPTPASTNVTEEPVPASTTADTHGPVKKPPSSSSKWRCFFPHFIILAPLLSFCL